MIPWIEVRGRAGYSTDTHEIVLVIDVSSSTLVFSEYDLDGDGHYPAGTTSDASFARLGISRESALARRLLAIDLEDSILMAEISAAEVLLDALDLETSRVGIVAFSNDARVLSPLTRDRKQLEAAIDGLRSRFIELLGATNFEAALTRSVGLWGGRDDEEGISRIIVFLSDGQPTRPAPPFFALQSAWAGARAAAEAGIRIYPFALGPPAIHSDDAYQEMVEISGGRLEKLVVPADVVPRLRALDLAGLQSISIVNATNGSSAVAVRTFPNGGFDGFLKLDPGKNQIRIDATLTDATRITVERTFTSLAADSLTPEQQDLARRQLRALLEQIRTRTLKLELLAEMQETRRKRIVIEAAEPWKRHEED